MFLRGLAAAGRRSRPHHKEEKSMATFVRKTSSRCPAVLAVALATSLLSSGARAQEPAAAPPPAPPRRPRTGPGGAPPPAPRSPPGPPPPAGGAQAGPRRCRPGGGGRRNQAARFPAQEDGPPGHLVPAEQPGPEPQEHKEAGRL